MPAPPPPPPPPPPAGIAGPPPSDSSRNALLTDIHKGFKLKKTVTNDRSGPNLGGKVSGSSPSGVSSNGHSSGSAAKPPAPSGGLGGLFANGLPMKPSDNKIRRATTNIGPPPSASSVPPPPPPPQPAVEGRKPSIIPSASFSASSNAPPPPPPPPPFQATIQSSKPTPPPPPPTQQSKPTTGREQFRTMRPARQTSVEKPMLRRSGSSEDIPHVSRVQRPGVPPPARPAAPPPPPPVPVVSASSTPSSRFQSPAPSRNEDTPAPPPPPRNASKVTGAQVGRVFQSAQPPVSSLSSPVVAPSQPVSYHPLNRFEFLPISQLPPPPSMSSGRA